jgi:hypothetical protein
MRDDNKTNTNIVTLIPISSNLFLHDKHIVDSPPTYLWQKRHSLLIIFSYLKAQRSAVEPPGRLCLHRFSIQHTPTKTPCALPPGRRPGRFQPRVGRYLLFLYLIRFYQFYQITCGINYFYPARF